MEIDDSELDRRLTDLRRALSHVPRDRDRIGSDHTARRPRSGDRERLALTSAGPDAQQPDAIPVSLRLVRSRQKVASRGEATHDIAPGTGRDRLKRRQQAAAAVVVAVLTALSVVGGFFLYRGSGQPAESPPTLLRVGVLPLVDVAAFYRAVDQEYFRKAGLEVQVVTVASGPEAVRGLETGRLDVAFSSYPGMFMAQATHAADLKIIAPAYTAKPGHLMLVGAPNHSFTRPDQAAHKRIGVTSRGSISDLLAISELQQAGGDPASITWVTMDMRAMVPAMQRGQIDGAVLAEPFVTTADKAGAVKLLDLGLDLNFEIAMSGWVVPARSAATRPEVIDAFQRALNRGVGDVQNRDVREQIFQQYLGVDATTARDVRVGSFPAHLDLGDIQRVADLMVQQKMLPGPFNVATMFLPGLPRS
ncbi:ABC transporter substrate-binding protein [Amycolatopsis lexingtonensis]|uniref:ABC transporter substrate-binding protein n=1 Tax=Amycolatopsis lexingtonensis TaxID=218822 RepID=UPI003F728C8F